MSILFFFWNIFVICYCCWIYLLVALLEVWYSYMRGLTLSLQWFTVIPHKQTYFYSKHFFLFSHNENSRISAFTGSFYECELLYDGLSHWCLKYTVTVWSWKDEDHRLGPKSVFLTAHGTSHYTSDPRSPSYL